GRKVWLGAVAIFIAVAALGLVTGLREAHSHGTIPVAGIGIGVPGIVNALLLLVLGIAMPKALTRRTGAGVALAARWDGLRRYLHDFSMIKEAPPASITLWEQLLVYGIVLG